MRGEAQRKAEHAALYPGSGATTFCLGTEYLRERSVKKKQGGFGAKITAKERRLKNTKLQVKRSNLERHVNAYGRPKGLKVISFEDR